MGLYRRNGVYYMRFFDNGKLLRLSTHTTSKREANALYIKTLGKKGKLPGQHTLGELIDRYLEEHSKPTKTPKSYKRDKSLSDHLLEAIGEKKFIDHISPSVLEAYKLTRRKEEAKPKTINNELGLLSSAFTKAIQWEWAESNPVNQSTKEKVRNIQERWLTYQEEYKLVSVCPRWLQEIITFAIETGLRQEELLSLKWEQIDFDRLALTLLSPKTETMNTLPLSKTAQGILKQRIMADPKKPITKKDVDKYVFTNSNGSKINARNLIRAFHAAIRKAKIKPLRFHDLRHTFATRLAQGGCDLLTIQKLGRWESLQMLNRYAHHYVESLRKGTDTLDQMRTQNPQIGDTKRDTMPKVKKKMRVRKKLLTPENIE